MNKQTKQRFLYVEFDRLDRHRLREELLMEASCKGFRYIVTPNVDHVINLRYNSKWSIIRQAYAHAAYVQNDSKVLTMLAKSIGLALPAYPGSDLTRDIFEGINKDAKVLIIGGDATAPDKLKTLFQLNHIDQHLPPFGLFNNLAAREACVEKAIASEYDYIFIAVGSPQGELIAYEIHKASPSGGVALCIGASIDFLTGHARRAPVIFQRFAMEWVYRLITEPKRLWRRYILGLPKILLLYLEWVKYSVLRGN